MHLGSLFAGALFGALLGGYGLVLAFSPDEKKRARRSRLPIPFVLSRLPGRTGALVYIVAGALCMIDGVWEFVTGHAVPL